TRGRTDQNLEYWQKAVLSAPHLLSESALISENDGRQFIEEVAARMGVDPASDIRPSLLVHTGLATAQLILQRWLVSDALASPPLDVQMEEALRISLAGFD
ncbi:MAG: hypothetical protein WAO15_14275, partial [Mycobacterium sp.]